MPLKLLSWFFIICSYIPAKLNVLDHQYIWKLKNYKIQYRVKIWVLTLCMSTKKDHKLNPLWAKGWVHRILLLSVATKPTLISQMTG